MMLWLLLLAFQRLIPPEGVGHIQVNTSPGIVVYLDGAPMGTTSADAGGLLIMGVTPGTHQLVLLVDGGGSVEMKAEVVKGQTSTVAVSSLALNAARKWSSGVEVRLTQPADGCVAAVDDREMPFTDSLAMIDGVASGRHRVTVRCGDRSWGRDVELTRARTALVEANAARGTLQVVGDRARVMDVAIHSANDRVVMNAPISSSAKRALSAALAPGIDLLEVRPIGGRAVRLRIEAANASAAEAFFQRLASTPGIEEVEVGRVSMITQQRATVDFYVLFSE
jgi:hypothetical protein